MKRRGFTLIESIVTIIVLSIMAFIVMYIFTEGFRIYVVNKNYIKLRADGRYALSRIAYEIKQAQDINPDGLNSPKMTLISDVDNDGNAETIEYERVGSLLMRRQKLPGGGWRERPICQNMVDSTFFATKDLDRTCVDIVLTLRSGSEEVKLWTIVTTRSAIEIYPP